MINVESNKISIFPSSNRGASFGERYGDNFVTEYNLSSIVNKLLLPKNGNNGFLISTTMGNNNEGKAEFNIGGYFVCINSWSDVITAATSSSETEVPGKIFQNFITFDVSGDGQNKTIFASAHLFTDTSTVSTAGSGEVSSATDGGVPSPFKKLCGDDGVEYNAIANTHSGGETIETDTITLNLLVSNDGGSSWKLCEDSKLRFVNLNFDDGVLE